MKTYWFGLLLVILWPYTAQASEAQTAQAKVLNLQFDTPTGTLKNCNENNCEITNSKGDLVAYVIGFENKPLLELVDTVGAITDGIIGPVVKIHPFEFSWLRARGLLQLQTKAKVIAEDGESTKNIIVIIIIDEENHPYLFLIDDSKESSVISSQTILNSVGYAD